mmetsp:Transcript_29477/g.63477  ORF Transcript_29477/g.63477 Transcript_29477/m.63477 type:complete len:227 (+) Transcript_29477:16-696(+)
MRYFTLSTTESRTSIFEDFLSFSHLTTLHTHTGMLTLKMLAKFPNQCLDQISGAELDPRTCILFSADFERVAYLPTGTIIITNIYDQQNKRIVMSNLKQIILFAEGVHPQPGPTASSSANIIAKAANRDPKPPLPPARHHPRRPSVPASAVQCPRDPVDLHLPCHRDHHVAVALDEETFRVDSFPLPLPGRQYSGRGRWPPAGMCGMHPRIRTGRTAHSARVRARK